MDIFSDWHIQGDPFHDSSFPLEKNMKGEGGGENMQKHVEVEKNYLMPNAQYPEGDS